jgi:hypothetical protein
VRIDHQLKSWVDRLKRMRGTGKVARSTAAAWMTLLIAVPVAVAFLTVWKGLPKATRPDELSVAALKLFAVWCLSFLGHVASGQSAAC